MEQQNVSHQQQQKVMAAMPMFIGAITGLLFISLFVFGVDDPNPNWSKYWMVKPLIITPIAGTMGGICFYFLNYLASRGSINKPLATIIGILIMLFAIWIGTVLGLDGTMWD